jgi:hypothetical protein
MIFHEFQTIAQLDLSYLVNVVRLGKFPTIIDI